MPQLAQLRRRRRLARTTTYTMDDLKMEQEQATSAPQPDNKKRKENGDFNTYFYEYRNHPDKFFEYTKTSMETFDYILDKIEEDLRSEVNSKKIVPPPEKLFLTLRFLGHGGSLRSLSQSFGLGRSTVSKVIYQTLKAIWTNLLQNHMPKPTRAVHQANADLFLSKLQFPNCIGAIDGKVILSFCKRKCTLVLHGVSNTDYKFIFVEVCEKEKDGDVYGKKAKRKQKDFAFRYSQLNSLLDENKFNVPPPEKLPGSDILVPYVLVGSEGYPLKTYLMRPYPPVGMDAEKSIFNERISKARVPIQSAFGILTNKFRIFSKNAIESDVKHTQLIIKVSCLLHNIIRDRDGDRDVDFREFFSKAGSFESEDKKCRSKCNNRATTYAMRIRDRFKLYFNTHLQEANT